MKLKLNIDSVVNKIAIVSYAGYYQIKVALIVFNQNRKAMGMVARNWVFCLITVSKVK